MMGSTYSNKVFQHADIMEKRNRLPKSLFPTIFQRKAFFVSNSTV